MKVQLLKKGKGEMAEWSFYDLDHNSIGTEFFDNIESAKKYAAKKGYQIMKIQEDKGMKKQPLKENYERLFGRMDKIDRLGIKKGKLNESIRLQDLEDLWFENQPAILDRMKNYGFESADSVDKIRNYRDLATILGVDARNLQGVDVEEYASYLSGLMDQSDQDPEGGFAPYRR